MNRLLKAKIVEKFGTQGDFAAAIKADEAVVSRVIRGRRELNVESQKKWADKLECRPVEIFQDN
ncbi:MAG: helix-turn-helix transcriptional regulator [Deltaproteobacteria bacterium]|nr:helix-turn-helix transcriptional regulator [Deltaproteobacteria bacterium]